MGHHGRAGQEWPLTSGIISLQPISWVVSVSINPEARCLIGKITTWKVACQIVWPEKMPPTFHLPTGSKAGYLNEALQVPSIDRKLSLHCTVGGMPYGI